MRVTIEQIAKAAGVSKTAVSFIINGKPGVGPSTRKRVLKVMDELGYRPNALARAFASNRSWMVCLLVPEYERVFNDIYFASTLSAVHKVCHQFKYRLVIESVSRDFLKEKQYEDLYMSRLVEGMLVVKATTGDHWLLDLREAGCPLILINNRLGNKIDYVSSDDWKCGYDAIRYLTALGHRNIALVTGSPDDSSSIDRREGALTAMKESGVKYREDLEVCGEYKYAVTRSAILSLLQKVDSFSAVFCLNDTMAIAAIDALREIGKDIPGDVSVIGVDNYDAYSSYNLTTFAQDVYSIGEQATRQFLEKLNGDIVDPIRIKIPMTLLPRGTTRRV